MTAEKGKNYGFWLSFFRGAGIQTGYDSKYALVFDENRIKPDMLMDVNKECLRDMGIKAMGDIIAITKHARKAHEESKTLAFESAKPTQLAAATTTTPAQLPERLKPAPSTLGRTVTRQPLAKPGPGIEKVTTTTPPTASNPASLSDRFAPHPVEVEDEDDSITVITRTAPASTANKRPDRGISISAGSLVVSTSGSGVRTTKAFPNTKDQPSASVSSETRVQKQIIRLNTSSDSSDSSSPQMLREEVPFQKKTRVLPEHEGKYKIIMPEGTTPRTVKLAQRAGPVVTRKEKSTIFDRLDRSNTSVTSTNDTRRGYSSSSSSGGRDDSKETKTSIFERLGGRRDVAGPSGSRDREDSRGRYRDEREERRRSRSRSPLYRSRPAPKTDRHYQVARYEETERVERVKLSRNSSPELESRGRGSFVKSARSTRTDEITYKIGSSRMRSELNASDRSVDIKSRLGHGVDADDDVSPPRKITKVFPSTTSRESLPMNVRVGQVLRTTKGVNKDGKPVTRRLIIKQLPKSRAGTSRSRLAMDDPLEDYFD